MQVKTKYFGEISADEEDVIHFNDGLYGFEDEHSYLLIPFDHSGGSLLCLQSLMTETLAFMVVNPFFIYQDYRPVISEENLKYMGVGRSEDLSYYTLCVVKTPLGESTINLKCPIVINDTTRKAAQIILDMPIYHMRHRLLEFKTGEAEIKC